ncbi:MAG: hypothetical protein FWF46_01625 [Oscillospiraceae bacterium]|nr:hypothetical protein [Oscillospiraceae bacterium]
MSFLKKYWIIIVIIIVIIIAITLLLVYSNVLNFSGNKHANNNQEIIAGESINNVTKNNVYIEYNDEYGNGKDAYAIYENPDLNELLKADISNISDKVQVIPETNVIVRASYFSKYEIKYYDVNNNEISSKSVTSPEERFLTPSEKGIYKLILTVYFNDGSIVNSLFLIDVQYSKGFGYLDGHTDGMLYKSFNITRNINTDFLKDMNKTTTYYYQVLNTYQEYIKYKEIMPEIRDLTEADFQRYFAIIILSDKNTDMGMSLDLTKNLEYPITQPSSAKLDAKANLVGMIVSVNRDGKRSAKIENDKLLIEFL